MIRLACERPADSEVPLARWSSSELAAEVVARGICEQISGVTVWRWLSEDAIKPWQHRSWIFPRDPEFTVKAGRILDLYGGRWEGELLHPGDSSARTRLVVRGAQVQRIRVIALEAGSDPATMTIDVDLRGRRYIEDRDTTRVLSGSSTHLIGFTERWQLAVTGDAAEPWRIVAVQSPAVPA